MKFVEWFNQNSPDHLKWFNQYLNTGRVPNAMIAAAQADGVDEMGADWPKVIATRLASSYVDFADDNTRRQLADAYLRFMLTSNYRRRGDLRTEDEVREFVTDNAEWIPFGHVKGKLRGVYIITDVEAYATDTRDIRYSSFYEGKTHEDLVKKICKQRKIKMRPKVDMRSATGEMAKV